MENGKKASSLRWGILRRALISSRSSTDADEQSEMNAKSISRRANRGFNLIPFHLVDNGHLKLEEMMPCELQKAREACVCYTLPNQIATKLFIYQRVDNYANLDDFRICNTYDIDNTGLVCSWPSEEVLAYYCISQLELFRFKKVIELGSGYGLAGLAIAAVTEALEVVISDGNPQVVDYIQRNINANLSVFGGTKVKSMMLHWNQEELLDVSNNFDIIVASDCTFFKEFHKGLVQTVKCLLKKEGSSEAIFLGPRRGNSLDDFLTEVKESGLRFTVDEVYDPEIWRCHESFINNDATWPNYAKDHCYPLLKMVHRFLRWDHEDARENDAIGRKHNIESRNFENVRSMSFSAIASVNQKEWLDDLLTPPWVRLFNINKMEYNELTKEFYCSFDYDPRETNMFKEDIVQFRLGREWYEFSVA